MSSPTRISRELIEEAHRPRHGHVSAAAEDLGIPPRGLYDRLAAFGIDQHAFRSGGGVTFSSSGVQATGHHFTLENDRSVRSDVNQNDAVRTSSGEKWHASPASHKFVSIMRDVGTVVGATVAAAAEDIGAAMTRTAQKAQTPRLRKNHLAFFHSLRRQINAQTDSDLTIHDVMEMYINWGGDRFAHEVLSRGKDAPRLPAGEPVDEETK